MHNNFKNSLVCLSIAILLLLGRPAYAQVRSSDVTYKDSLIQMLYQYGKEVFHRGLDPQEAAFTFQRILVLDCRHEGAQQFLERIRNKYPHVSIKIAGCPQEETGYFNDGFLEMPDEVTRSSLREERLGSGRIGKAVKGKKGAKDELKIPSTPLRAFSEPVDLDVKTPQERLETPNSIDNFPIIEPTEPTVMLDSSYGPKNDMNGLTEDCDELRAQNTQLTREIDLLTRQIQIKDETIARYQKEIASVYGSSDPSYALISKDQKDLIRIQQENIDDLEKELAFTRSQITSRNNDDDPKYNDMRQQVADAQLMAKEKELDLEIKNREAQLLNKQKVELEEQLGLVRKILAEKNDIIKTLQDELQAVQAENN